MRDSSDDPLVEVRKAYAKAILSNAGVDDPRLKEAFSSLRREDFLGPGPWQIYDLERGYVSTPDANPIHLYEDVLVGIAPDKGLNNGVPSYLSFLISLGMLKEGDHAVHIGAGQGYYTAVMASLVGPCGCVTAVEYEADLAMKASKNLARFENTDVRQGDGTKIALDPADAIYVNAGAARPADVWLDALKDGGRLILPLTVNSINVNGTDITAGAVFLIQREGDDFLATWKSGTVIYPCFGGRDHVSETALARGFEKGGWEKVTRLFRSDDVDDKRCWVRAPGWALGWI